MLQTVDPLAEAGLALEGAKARVLKANQEILHFRRTHMAVINGETVYLNENPAARAHLDRELYLLEVERDTAFRYFQKCLTDYNALHPKSLPLQPAPTRR